MINPNNNLPNIDSLALQTDLYFLKNATLFSAAPNNIIIKYKSFPDYYWGNFIHYLYGPQSYRDYELWTKTFQENFEELDHILFTWTGKQNIKYFTIPFLKEGFEQNTTTILTTRKLKNPKTKNNKIKIHQTEDSNWEKILKFQQDFYLFENDNISSEYNDFLKKKISIYRELSKEGAGKWFYATINGKIVAELGLYSYDNIARFQDIKTHPEYRGQNIARTLIEYASMQFNEHLYVIEVKEPSTAHKLYISIGFKKFERRHSLFKLKKKN